MRRSSRRRRPKHCVGPCDGPAGSQSAQSSLLASPRSAPLRRLARASGPPNRSQRPAPIAAPAPAGSSFGPTLANPGPPPTPPPAGMVWVPGGEFSMGSADPRVHPEGGSEPMDDARPVHRVYVDGFFMDRTEVTNAEFARFVTRDRLRDRR